MPCHRDHLNFLRWKQQKKKKKFRTSSLNNFDNVREGERKKFSMRWRGLGAGFEEQKESLPKKHERRHWQSTTYFSLDCELAISQ